MYIVILCLIVLLICCIASVVDIEIASPDGSIRAMFGLSDSGQLQYSVLRNEKTVLTPSAIGITVDGANMGSNCASLSATDPVTVHDTYKYRGVKDKALNHYTEVTITAEIHADLDKNLNLIVRVYNDGIAYRYTIPGKGLRKITGEASSWSLPPGTFVYWAPSSKAYEGTYKASAIGSFASNIGGPITFELPGGDRFASGFATITEGQLVDYSGMTFRAEAGSGVFHSIFQDDEEWTVEGGGLTPWRITIIACDLDNLVNSTLVENVNPAPSKELANADWIRPGKVLWSWWAHDTRLEDQERYIDAANEMKFAYVLWDEGWPNWPQDKFDALLHRAVDKNVCVWLWYHWDGVSTPEKRSQVYGWIDSKNQEIGGKVIVGVKVDFMDSECFDRIQFYQDNLKAAAKHHLMINYHGAYKPTGEARSYPNEMTREGIQGLEYNKFLKAGLPASHNVILPFTRLIAGHADYTPGAIGTMLGRGTPAHHLASGIIYTSPVTHWADDPKFYLSSPARPILEAVPTVWDETRVLNKRIGELCIFARRSGDTWFLGAMQGDLCYSRHIDIPLGFLAKGQAYKAVIISDHPDDVTKMNREDCEVSATGRLEATLLGGHLEYGLGVHGGGFVAMFSPKQDLR